MASIKLPLTNLFLERDARCEEEVVGGGGMMAKTYTMEKIK